MLLTRASLNLAESEIFMVCVGDERRKEKRGRAREDTLVTRLSRAYSERVENRDDECNAALTVPPETCSYEQTGVVRGNTTARIDDRFNV